MRLNLLRAFVFPELLPCQSVQASLKTRHPAATLGRVDQLLQNFDCLQPELTPHLLISFFHPYLYSPFYIFLKLWAKIKSDIHLIYLLEK
jgi:hypothetical protein